jgi:shikimate kinase
MSQTKRTRNQELTNAETGTGQPLSRLLLTGFMGAGKSTVGALLARTLAWEFLDLDQVIEASHGQSVAEIFGSRGEAYFRGEERAALVQLRRKDRLVLALGGGTIEDPSVLSDILGWQETCLVFLDAPLAELLGRVQSGSHTRPLLARPEELTARHQRRLPLYRAAHVTVVTTGLGQREVAARVLELLSEAWQPRGKATAHGRLL